MDSGIYFNLQPNALIFTLVGELRAPDCKPLIAFIDAMETKAQITPIKIDLNATTFLDSTMLGWIGQLGFFSLEHDQAKPIMYCQSEDIKKLLKTMGIIHLFDIKPGTLDQDNYIKMDSEALPAESLKKRVIEAHETLIKIDPDNALKFKDLLDKLKP